MPCGHLLGKGLPLGSRLWCLTLSLLLSHWYPGSSVVLDCIDSWSLHPYLLYIFEFDNFVCFVALRPKSTAMVMAGRSVHLTTLFPGQA